ncbi:MAG: MurR/RpiR family transcriptional regulator [Mesorhizobium sp.]|nr:MAG: MurR/RpiR family transcriptional regulator [Mesorhizobium sp.]
MAIRDVLMRGDLALTPSEEKIVRLLLTDYPTSGLGTASSLARRAGVSDPTVVRLVMKLGYDGFADFQAKLLAEVEARLHSPLLMMEAKRPTDAEDSAILAYLGSVGSALEKSVSLTPLQSYERAARLLMETKGEVVMLGGRFSRHIAGMLAGYMLQFRPGVRDLGTLSAQAFDTLAPAMAQMEALVAQIVATLSDGARERIERLEEVRHANAVTLDSAGPEENAARRMPGPKSAQPRSAQAKSVKQDQKA